MVESVPELVVAVVGGRAYGFVDVEEVLPLANLLPMPGAPPSVLGVLDRRGTRLPVVSAHTRLDLPQAGIDYHSPLLVCRSGGALFAVLVERVLDVLPLQPGTITALPEHLPRAPFICGVMSIVMGEDLLVIDSAAFFSFEARRRWAEQAPAPEPVRDATA